MGKLACLVSREDPHQLATGRDFGAMRALAYLTAVQGPGFTWDIAVAEFWIAEIFGTKRTELDRRLRYFTPAGWEIRRSTTGGSHTYTLERIGDFVWHPGYRQHRGRAAAIRAALDARDPRECAICERRRNRDRSPVNLTVGRILPETLGGAYTLRNCRLECSLCNSSNRDSFPRIGDVPVHGDASDDDAHQRLRDLARYPAKLEEYSLVRAGRVIA